MKLTKEEVLAMDYDSYFNYIESVIDEVQKSIISSTKQKVETRRKRVYEIELILFELLKELNQMGDDMYQDVEDCISEYGFSPDDKEYVVRESTYKEIESVVDNESISDYLYCSGFKT